jgi:hypothetical protein
MIGQVLKRKSWLVQPGRSFSPGTSSTLSDAPRARGTVSVSIAPGSLE